MHYESVVVTLFPNILVTNQTKQSITKFIHFLWVLLLCVLADSEWTDGTGIKFTKESLLIGETFIIIVLILLNEFWRNKICCTKNGNQTYANLLGKYIKVKLLQSDISQYFCIKVLFANFQTIFTVNVYHNITLLCWVRALVFLGLFCLFIFCLTFFISFIHQRSRKISPYLSQHLPAQS